MMNNPQIENTIAEIRKRSGAVTVFMFMIFLISSSIIPTFVFAVEVEEVEIIENIILREMNSMRLNLAIERIVIGVVIAFAIPFIYLEMQKRMKRKSIRKIWKSRLDMLDAISLNSLNSSSSTLQQIIFELSKMEILVAESFNEVDYLEYAGTIQHFNELIKSISPRNYILNELKKYLCGLVFTN